MLFTKMKINGISISVAFVALAFLNINVWAEGSMSKLITNGTLPPERDSFGISSMGSDIYIFGGVRDDFNTQLVKSYNDIHRFDTKTNTWTTLAPTGQLPPPRGFSTDFASDGIVYIFGGTSFSTLRKGSDIFKDMIMFNDLWAYSVSKNSWTQIQPLNAPPPSRAKSIGWMVGNKIYIFGGVTATWTTLNDLWVFDIDTKKWTQLIKNGDPGAPMSRQEAQGGLEPDSNGNLAIIYGGESIGGDSKQPVFSILNDTWEYNIKNNKWTNVTPKGDKNIFPTHTYSNAALIGNYFYIQSGDLQGVGSTSGCGAPFPQSVGDDLWKFDLTTHEWTQISACGSPMPRMKRTGAIAADNRMYMFFGYDFICYDDGKPGQIWIKNTYMYDPKGICKE